jgi:hypothetical protein
VIGKWNKRRILTRFPYNTFQWNELMLGRSFHQFLLFLPVVIGIVKRDGGRFIRSLFNDLFSSRCWIPNSGAVLTDENRELRLSVGGFDGGCIPLPLPVPINLEASQSNPQTSRLRAIVQAMIERKRPRQTPNKSCGRKPIV